MCISDLRKAMLIWWDVFRRLTAPSLAVGLVAGSVGTTVLAMMVAPTTPGKRVLDVIVVLAEASAAAIVLTAFICCVMPKRVCALPHNQRPLSARERKVLFLLALVVVIGASLPFVCAVRNSAGPSTSPQRMEQDATTLQNGQERALSTRNTNTSTWGRMVVARQAVRNDSVPS